MVTHCQHQPVGSGVQHETHLIGQSRTATGAVRGKLALVQVDGPRERCPETGSLRTSGRNPAMGITMIGLDTAKSAFKFTERTAQERRS